MTSALHAHRDDGPLAVSLSKLGRQPAPVAATAAGALGLGFLLVADGAHTGGLALGGVALFVLLAALGQVRATPSPLAWLVPPLLRATEYATVVYLAWRIGGSAPAAAFVLLWAAAFHQYDVDHRLRTRGVAPPRTVGHMGLGWDGRLLVLTVAAWLGVFSLVAAAVAVVFFLGAVGENVLVWRHRPAPDAKGTPGGLGPAGR